MLRKFARFYRPHLKLFTLDFSCALLLALISLVFPWSVRYVIDNVIPVGDTLLLLKVAGGLLMLCMVSYGLDYIVTYWGHILGIRIEYDMREQLFTHIQKLSFNYFDNTRTGHIMSRLVNDLGDIGELAHHGPEDIFVAGVTFVGSFIILFNMNPKLASAMLLILPIMLYFAAKRNREMKRTFKKQREKIAEINAQVEDSIGGIRVVKAFSNEEYEIDKFNRENRSYMDSRQATYRAMARFFPGIHLFSNLFQLSVLLGGGYLLQRGEMTMGELLSFFLYVSLFLRPVFQITSLIEQYQRAMSGFGRFLELMEMEPDISDSKNAVAVGRLQGHIRFENVAFSYNDKENVLKNINLEIKPGETVALVGPSGAGKTTLCSLIPRFYEVDAGRILIDGIDIKDMTQKSLRENIGVVQQDVFLFSESVKSNILYGRPDANEIDILQASKKANAHQFIEKFENGYETTIGERGVKLSGGQKQRLSIARVFLKNPPILILDEATSSLDNQTEMLVQRSLSALAHERTALIIAHRLATIRYADRIIVLTDEGVEESGTHDELLKLGGVYARLYSAQFEAME